jgi:hypothetical protein
MLYDSMANDWSRRMADASLESCVAARVHVRFTAELIEVSREAVRSSRDLLEHTLPISFRDLVTR